MHIKVDDLSNGAVTSLLEEHLQDMYATSPAESVHALDIPALQAAEITFFSAWLNDALAGCIAIKQLTNKKAEIKSMRTSLQFRNMGVASKLVEFVIHFAQQQGFAILHLETGTQTYFAAARHLYKKHGFKDCGPFSTYKLDPNSHFMCREL